MPQPQWGSQLCHCLHCCWTLGPTGLQPHALSLEQELLCHHLHCCWVLAPAKLQPVPHYWHRNLRGHVPLMPPWHLQCPTDIWSGFSSTTVCCNNYNKKIFIFLIESWTFGTPEAWKLFFTYTNSYVKKKKILNFMLKHLFNVNVTVPAVFQMWYRFSNWQLRLNCLAFQRKLEFYSRIENKWVFWHQKDKEWFGILE